MPAFAEIWDEAPEVRVQMLEIALDIGSAQAAPLWEPRPGGCDRKRVCHRRAEPAEHSGAESEARQEGVVPGAPSSLFEGADGAVLTKLRNGTANFGASGRVFIPCKGFKVTYGRKKRKVLKIRRMRSASQIFNTFLFFLP